MARGKETKATEASPGGAVALPAARMRLHPDQVVVGHRLRGLTEAKVQALMVSYGETGALPPIITRPLSADDDKITVELVAGLHRREACRRLGILVDCMVRPMSDLEARLVECDENLLAPDLSPYDRAVFIQARLEAWAARFPERVAADGDGQIRAKRGRPEKGANFAHLPLGMGFTTETAADIGLSPRTVKAALATFRGLKPATRAQVAGTWIARNEGALRQLAGIADAGHQATVLKVLLDGGAKNVSDAMAIAAGRQPKKVEKSATDEAIATFKKTWKASSETQRRALLDWLAGEKLPAGWSVTSGNLDNLSKFSPKAERRRG